MAVSSKGGELNRMVHSIVDQGASDFVPMEGGFPDVVNVIASADCNSLQDSSIALGSRGA